MRAAFTDEELFVKPLWNLDCSRHSVFSVRRSSTFEALPGVFGIQGEWLFIFRDLVRMVICFQGFGEILGFKGAGSEGLRKNILGSWGERSFFFQGAGSKDPPGGLTFSRTLPIIDRTVIPL